MKTHTHSRTMVSIAGLLATTALASTATAVSVAGKDPTKDKNPNPMIDIADDGIQFKHCSGVAPGGIQVNSAELAVIGKGFGIRRTHAAGTDGLTLPQADAYLLAKQIIELSGGTVNDPAQMTQLAA